MMCLCVGCAGRPCDAPSSPVGGTFTCKVDAATGKVLTGNTCELTCHQFYTPSVALSTITCVDGAMDATATCIGALLHVDSRDRSVKMGHMYVPHPYVCVAAHVFKAVSASPPPTQFLAGLQWQSSHRNSAGLQGMR